MFKKGVYGSRALARRPKGVCTKCRTPALYVYMISNDYYNELGMDCFDRYVAYNCNSESMTAAIKGLGSGAMSTAEALRTVMDRINNYNGRLRRGMLNLVFK